MTLPDSIRRRLGDRLGAENSVGCSQAQVFCFDDMVLKVGASEEECVCLRWLRGRLPVPEVLEFVRRPEGNFLLMSRVPGEMLCADAYRQTHTRLVRLLAEALDALAAVDVSGCPYDNRLENALARAGERIERGACDADACREAGFSSPERLLVYLSDNRPPERLVFTHGDCCLPNLFAAGDRVSGFIDLGSAGLADRYRDIALCYRSLKDNLGGRYGGARFAGGFEPDALFSALGLAPDWEAIRYYQLLDRLA